MKKFDEGNALDLIEMGVRLALDVPGEIITVELRELDLCIEIELDELDRMDTSFVDSIPGLALNDIRRKLLGLEPRFVAVKRYSRLVVRG